MIEKEKVLKRFLAFSIVFTLVLAVAPASPAYAGVGSIAVDVVFVVDESGSMGDEQDFLPTITAKLETAFTNAGVGTGVNANKYGAVGYACSSNLFPGTNTPDIQDPRVVIPLGTPAAFNTAVIGGAFCVSGGLQDGFEAIIYATNPANMNYRGGNVVKHIILVTDEDRDDSIPTFATAGLTTTAQDFASTLAALNGFLFNAIVCFDFEDANNNPALGVVPPTGGTAYTENQNPPPTFNKSGGGNPSGSTTCGALGNSGTTLTDYIALADDKDGGAWDVFAIGGGNAQTQEAFADALADAKVKETLQIAVGGTILPVSTTALLLAGLSTSAMWLIPLAVIGGGAFALLRFQVLKQKN